jgi:cellulose synthase/poly-beta-1,6-N-acetylglucosamine synthase-like glycosyltransferase
MQAFSVPWICFQVIIGLNLIMPLILYLAGFLKKTKHHETQTTQQPDYAIIVTAYEQTTLLKSVIDSLLKLRYSNYHIYIVADKCDIAGLHFPEDKVSLLRPEYTLSSNVRSHFYAISHFIRAHECLTIIDSDNLVDPDYLNELNEFFAEGYIAVQGVRAAKNLNTRYACLDEAGDIYYRFTDRKLLFDIGSSTCLSGSGMAFQTAFYKECLAFLHIEGAGFDKFLQMEILNKGQRIAFAEKAVVYDEKTSRPDQLIKQRARWINTSFRYAGGGIKLSLKGLWRFNWNQFVCGIIFSRPPLFISVLLTSICMAVDFILMPAMLYFWLFAITSFGFIFFMALKYFNAAKPIYQALWSIPLFMFLQMISLLRARRANAISTATWHYHDRGIDEVQR